MALKEFFYLIGVFIALMFAFRYADRWIKSLPRSTAKVVNWIGFAVAAVGGVAWYATDGGIYMLITVAGVIIYFLFYHYDGGEDAEDGSGAMQK